MKTKLDEALRALDEALADAPKRNGEAFSKTLRCLTLVRGGFYARDGRKTEQSRERLDQLNGCISIVLAGHFPLGEPPWEEIRGAKAWLQGIIGAA